MRQEEDRRRVVIEGIDPEIDCGRFPIKRTVGESVVVEADVFGDGHDAVSCALRYRHESEDDWRESAMEPLVNDRWRGSFRVAQQGRYLYTLAAWVDHFRTWRLDLRKRLLAGQDVSVDLLIGADIVASAAEGVSGDVARQLHRWADRLRMEAERGAGRAAPATSPAKPGGAAQPSSPTPTAVDAHPGLDPELAQLMADHGERRFTTVYQRELPVRVDRERARFSAWYEMFPRSASPEPGRHGTFRDVERRLPYVAELGFDVLYLPPIHPIGETKRKGPNNAVVSGEGDPGSPWAIGGEAGGHKAIHPELGTIDDFRRLVRAAEKHGIEIALDIAFQCSPDHPYVREHPEWFRARPDGTVQYAENPPKKYEDIYPFDFETEAWRALWDELLDVFLFWIGHGVRMFRVDNPHTKPFAFWEWLIAEVHREHPDVIFLSEAFTRPKVMYRLAKLGFTQSYTYFAWRNTAWELREYFEELTQTEPREFFRPNLWPNTPDILTEYLQTGGRPAFAARAVLAATLGASYGIYGPAFELLEHRPRHPGSEEYLDSEKYQLRHWDLDRPESLRELVARLNRIRRENPALQYDDGLRFHRVDNEELLVYSKRDESATNVILVVVNLNPYYRHAGWVDLDLDGLGLDPEHPFQVHDLLGDTHYIWHGAHNFVELNPHATPAHVFLLGQHLRTETDFEYYM